MNPPIKPNPKKQNGQNPATHISVLVGARSHPGVHVADVTGGPNDQGGTSVNDGLATTVARHWVTVDGDTVDNTT